MTGHGLHLVPVGDGQVVLKRGINELLVSGEDAEAVAQPLLDGLATGAAVDVVLMSLPVERRQAAVQLLQALASRQMLGNGAEAGDDTPQESFYANFGPAARSVPDALAAAHVAVHGIGFVTCGLVEGLAAVGVGRVTVIDEAPLRNAAASADARAELPRSSVQLLDGPDAVISDADIVVATSDLGQEHALLEVGRRALASQSRFLPAWLAEMTGYVGPLTHPFETACLRCYLLRVDSNDPNRAARRALRRRVAEDAAVGAASGLLTPMASVVAQIAVMEVAKELGGFAPVDAVGRSIEINLVSFRSSVRRVLKVPRCPDCGEPARRTSRTMFSGIQIAG
ncbi:MAG: TOMM precursor leader peptide-binding protein [Chloroflexota bacterium]|nr:TOMM precursor leader peptide-binding protein [Chloroflexota bacterium]